ncbi:glycoside hydrolase family 2 [Bacillus sp. FJAT-27264]|uniref:glycoside hydrolase family 2 TIM barrel-domain containing protein n=1 Tax=Paenibacillus sp. (strain DSM 101736 / FJAT-27264) TaxID=1850362 RepID=UPI000807FF8A|nr:glycoside hydrolase family 2 TIM barrel-domain containing protein [Bacillus sp. FJAT-27264]OBZ19291.1 glycoside hydrolase family 2 [Bacillus sp. FJAT-27264]
MRTRENFDTNWIFHFGEVGKIAKTVKKAGMIAGLTNALEEERHEPFAMGEAARITQDVIRELMGDPNFEISQIYGSDTPGDKHTGWVSVDLPHDWRLEQPYSQKEHGAAFQGYLPGGVGYYRKVFQIPQEDEGKKIVIEFDGVMRASSVWVNGCFVGDHLSGYTSFHYDITDLLKYGEAEGDNVILVRTDTTGGEEGWWYEGGGIYRHVWLTKHDYLHVDRWGTFVRTDWVENETAAITVETTISNEYSRTLGYRIRTSILDRNGKLSSTTETDCTTGGLDKLTTLQSLQVPHPQLWSLSTPHLYEVITELLHEGSIVDTYRTVTGIRMVEYRQDGLYLNGEYVLLKGTCNHQDFAGVGIALPDRVHEYKIKRLLEMGCNAYRCAHHPPAPELLEACDRLGMLVMNENRVMESTEIKLEELKSMLYRDRNHPSIFMWSLGNEEKISGSYQAKRMLKRIRELATKIDPTRPLTVACLSQDGIEIDVNGVNYAESVKGSQSIGEWFHDHPQAKVLNTENVSFFSTRGVYEDDPEGGRCSSYGSKYTMSGKEMDVGNLGGAGGTSTPERSWRYFLDNRFSGGLFVWTGFDYRGETTPFQWPSVTSQFGVLDYCGFAKDSYYFYQSIWKDEPIVHLMPHWNWPERVEQPVEVRVYTNCSEVELVLNGQSLGIKKAEVDAGEHTLSWQVVYESGVLEAVAYREGMEVARERKETTTEAYAIHLEADGTELVADGQDVSIITVTVRDTTGKVVPVANNLIQFQVSGQGKLLGLGNGDPGCHESDKGNARSVFNGYALAIVQSLNQAGNIQIEASSVGLVPGVLILTSKDSSAI